MCVIEAQRFAFAHRLLVTGQYDLEGFQEITGKLRDVAAVKNLYFTDKFPGSDAVSTFDIRTDLDRRKLKALLSRITGVTEVNFTESARRTDGERS